MEPHVHLAILDDVRRNMAAEELDAIVVGPGADLRYLAGYDAPALTRLTALVVREEDTTLLSPVLEVARAERAGVDSFAEIRAAAETDDAIGLLADALRGAERIGVADRFWARFLLPLQHRLSDASFVAAQPAIAATRARKHPEELDALRRAGQAIDRVHARAADFLVPGRTERECAARIGDAILEEGHEAVNFVIVAAGSHGASPHHEPDDTVLEVGDVIVLDIGGTVDGYGSDCTRNYVLGEANDEVRWHHDVLAEAQEAAVRAVRPGATSHDVDAAARDLLTERGLGERFIHRTGHGIGLDEHEDPYILPGGADVLTAGMTFSIEPGVYLPGRFGLRIEDIVAVTADGVERFNHCPIELRVL